MAVAKLFCALSPLRLGHRSLSRVFRTGIYFIAGLFRQQHANKLADHVRDANHVAVPSRTREPAANNLYRVRVNIQVESIARTDIARNLFRVSFLQQSQTDQSLANYASDSTSCD